MIIVRGSVYKRELYGEAEYLSLLKLLQHWEWDSQRPEPFVVYTSSLLETNGSVLYVVECWLLRSVMHGVTLVSVASLVMRQVFYQPYGHPEARIYAHTRRDIEVLLTPNTFLGTARDLPTHARHATEEESTRTPA